MHTNGVTFETNAIRVTSSVQAHSILVVCVLANSIDGLFKGVKTESLKDEVYGIVTIAQ